MASGRNYPRPWRVERIAGGYRVVDAAGIPICYLYARDDESSAQVAKTHLTEDALRLANDIANSQRLRTIPVRGFIQ